MRQRPGELVAPALLLRELLELPEALLELRNLDLQLRLLLRELRDLRFERERPAPLLLRRGRGVRRLLVPQLLQPRFGLRELLLQRFDLKAVDSVDGSKCIL